MYEIFVFWIVVFGISICGMWVFEIWAFGSLVGVVLLMCGFVNFVLSEAVISH